MGIGSSSVLSEPACPIRLTTSQATVLILNDDEPGTLSFDVNEVMAVRGMSCVTTRATRAHGLCGRISCQFETVDVTARAGVDYVYAQGSLVFDDGEEDQCLQVSLVPNSSKVAKSFKLVLCNGSEGVKFGADSRLRDSAECEIFIAGRERRCTALRCCRSGTGSFSKEMALWADQFVAAVYCQGNEEEQSDATWQDWFSHAVFLVWKLLFSTVPPASLWGGWPCFMASLTMVGFVTFAVKELALLLGCCCGLSGDITAITLVALGTSVPDTFASWTAARQDDTADNSIGNVTGSNSVNVSLGLGLPWTIGSLYWWIKGATPEWHDHKHRGRSFGETFHSRYPEGGFMVPAGSFSVSVGIFSVAAILCISLLLWRRCRYGGELGGPKLAQRRDAGLLLVLWVVYIVASIIVSVTWED